MLRILDTVQITVTTASSSLSDLLAAASATVPTATENVAILPLGTVYSRVGATATTASPSAQWDETMRLEFGLWGGRMIDLRMIASSNTVCTVLFYA